MITCSTWTSWPQRATHNAAELLAILDWDVVGEDLHHRSALDNFESAVFKGWDEDAHSPGTFAYFKLGQVSRCLPHLRRAEGRLHFACGHLGPLLFRGIAQAAMESGRNAAQEILEVRG